MTLYKYLYPSDKDAAFVNECAMVMKRGAPETRHTADYFCKDNTELLLSIRDLHNAAPAGALSLACIHLLTESPELIINSELSYSEYQSLIDASIYGRAQVEKGSLLSRHFMQPLSIFAAALESDNGRKLSRGTRPV